MSHAEASKQHVPSLKIVSLEGAGHWLMIEKRSEVTNTIGDWIANTLKRPRVAPEDTFKSSGPISYEFAAF